MGAAPEGDTGVTHGGGMSAARNRRWSGQTSRAGYAIDDGGGGARVTPLTLRRLSLETGPVPSRVAVEDSADAV